MSLQGPLTELFVFLAGWVRKSWPTESWAKVVAVLLDLAVKLIPVLFRGGPAKLRRLERVAIQLANAAEESMRDVDGKESV